MEVSVNRISILILGCIVVTHGFSQQLEQYQAKKEAEALQPNPYLLGQPEEKRDLIQEYYQRILSLQPTTTAAAGGVSEDMSQLQVRSLSALEGAVDSNAYIVGPGDVFAGIWGIMFTPRTMAVSPEGTLVIPTVGVINVAGKSLAETKRMVIKRIKEKYPAGEVNVALITPRVFRVTVSGVVAVPGVYVVSAIDRVDRVVALANIARLPTQAGESTTSPLLQQKGPSYFNVWQEKKPLQMSLRHIRVLRRNGDTVKADLIRYYATGDRRYNPTLLDGDVVIVPAERKEGLSVSIWGAVRLEGEYEFCEGDSLSTALEIAQGALPDADLQHVEIARLVAPDSVVTFLVDYEAIQQKRAPDVPLLLNDRIYVRADPHKFRTQQITIRGEVQYPGAYPIQEGHTTLSEVIKRAGGFTTRASLVNAKVIRNQRCIDPALRNPDYRRLLEMRLSSMTKEERDYFDYEAALNRQYVSVDFVRLFQKNDRDADVELEDGDEIIIPPEHQDVYVFGQVNQPGYVPFVAGNSVDDYIERCGGVSDAADPSGVQVIKAGTKEWVSAKATAIEPGDRIWVPKKPVREFGFYWAMVRDVFGVITSVATAVILYIQVTKR